VYYCGRNRLNSRRANYSFGGLHRVFQIAFKAIHFENESPQHMLILGFGAGSVASIVQEEYGKTDVCIIGVEQDEVIIEIGKKYFNTERFSNTTIVCSDALAFIQQSQQHYDVIIVDIYDEVTVPEVFESDKFIKELHAHLNTGGYVLFNKVAHNKQLYEKFQALHKCMLNTFTRVDIVKALGMNRVLIAYR
jgi:spermidine synthase